MISTPQFLLFLLKINSEHAFKAQFVTFSIISAPAPKNGPQQPLFCIKKPLEGLQNSRVTCRFTLFGHVADFATPPYVFKVFRSRIWPFWAQTCTHFMVSSRIATFFAYKHRPDLDSKREVRKWHQKDCLNRYHLCTFASKHEKSENHEMLVFLVVF